MKLARGMTLEKIVETAAFSYRHYGMAHIFKRATGMSIKGDFIARAGVDFNGLIAGGRFIGIETKEVKTKNFNLQLIHEHQVKELRAIEKLGGLAYVLIRFSDTDEYFMIPLHHIEGHLQGFKQRIKKAAAKKKPQIVSEGIGVLNRESLKNHGFQVPKGTRNVYIDFLHGIV